MKPVLRKEENLEGSVSVTFTQRDIWLLNLCLRLVDQNHANGGTLHHDIQNLQDKLTSE